MKSMVYTIDKEGYVIDQFETDREVAMQNYFRKSNPKGFYYIANVGDDIRYKWRRKPKKSIYQTTPSENPDLKSPQPSSD